MKTKLLLILALYLVASLITFIAYALDKRAARKGNWRTPENTLHLLALIGGWPGALTARKLLRHKTKKQPFRTIFWATVVLNCAACAALFTPAADELWRSVGQWPFSCGWFGIQSR
ncbi:MAG: DUF1294 domain-containing protein [Acidobacteriota bacterium]|nr:DUF1294 domain-containing protein [Acidobacteriota bacterium]